MAKINYQQRIKGFFSKIFSNKGIGTLAGYFTAIDFSIVGAISFVTFLPVLLPFLGIQYSLNAAIGIGIASGFSGFAVESQIYVGDIKSVFKLFFKDGISWAKTKHNIRSTLKKTLAKKEILDLLKKKKLSINGDAKGIDKPWDNLNFTQKELAQFESDAFRIVMGKMFRKTFNYKQDPKLHAWYRYQLKCVINKKKPSEEDWKTVYDNFCIQHPQKAQAFIAAAIKDKKISKLVRHQLAEILIEQAKAKIKEDKTLTLETALFKSTNKCDPKANIEAKFKKQSFLLVYVAPIVSLLAAVSFGAYSYTIFLSAFLYLGAAGLGAICPAALIGILVIVPCAMWWYKSLSNAITSELHIKMKNSFTKLIRPKGYENYKIEQKIAHGVAVFFGSILLATIFALSIILSFCAAGVYLQQNLELATTLGIKITQAGLWINRAIFAPSILAANIIFALEHLIEFAKKMKTMGASLITELKHTNWGDVCDAVLDFISSPYRWIGVLLFTVYLAVMVLHFACEAAMTVYGQGSSEELINRFVTRIVGFFNACFGADLPSDLATFFVKAFDEFFDDADFLVGDDIQHHGHDHGISYGKICHGIRANITSKIYNSEKDVIPMENKEANYQEFIEEKAVSYKPIFFDQREFDAVDPKATCFKHTPDALLTPIAALVA